MDRFRGDRSPGRGQYPSRDPGDSYVPGGGGRGGYRQRSRTPPRGDVYRGRPRSPPSRRYDSYDGRRDYNGGGNSRYDERDLRGRDYSPSRSGPRSPRRSPPRRPQSPRDGYRARSRSPGRRGDDSYGNRSWRRRSTSPGRDGSGRASVASSRRSSPRGYSRRSSDKQAPGDSYRSPHPNSPRHHPTPPTRPRSRSRDARGSAEPLSAGSAPDSRDRPPPSGPAGSRFSVMSPPTGPSGAPASLSSQSRPPIAGSAPTGPYGTPRGGYGGGFRGRGGPASRGDFSGSPRRGSWSSPGGRGGFDGRAGGRAADPYPPREPYVDPRSTPGRGGFRGSGASANPQQPHWMRHLADLAKIKPGGEALPPLYDTSKGERLREEEERLRKIADEQQRKKRRGLREWDRLQREVELAALRSDLAWEHVRKLNGEEEAAPAF